MNFIAFLLFNKKSAYDRILAIQRPYLHSVARTAFLIFNQNLNARKSDCLLGAIMYSKPPKASVKKMNYVFQNQLLSIYIIFLSYRL